MCFKMLLCNAKDTVVFIEKVWQFWLTLNVNLRMTIFI